MVPKDVAQNQRLYNLLIENTRKMISKLKLKTFKIGKRYSANTAFVIFKILKIYNSKIDVIDYITLHRVFAEIHEELIETTYKHFFGYLYQSLISYKRRNYYKLQYQINLAIYDMEIMGVKILYSRLYDYYEYLDDSLSNIFFERIDNMIECDKLVLKNEELKYLWNLALYNLCTANKILNLYIQTNKGIYRQKSINLCKKISAILSDFINKHNIEYFYKYPSLLTYILYNLESNKQFVSQNHPIHSAILRIRGYLPTLFSKATFKHLCWMCINLYDLDKELFNQAFRLFLKKLLELKQKRIEIPKQELPQVVLVLAYYLSDKYNGKLNFDFPIEFEKIDFENVYNILFPKYQQESYKINVSDEDLRRLQNMDDSEIRKSLSKIIKMSDKIPEYVKQKLDTESEKPHTSAEISDFEIEIKINNKPIYVCFPIKSGREIRGRTVSENYIYQITKPFIHYKNCVVIFLTAKRCSVNLRNAINKYKERFSLPIGVLEAENLAKLFKVYGVL